VTGVCTRTDRRSLEAIGPRDLEQQVPTLHLVANVAFVTMPDLVGRLSKRWLSGAVL
jgi:hypothetical protein